MRAQFDCVSDRVVYLLVNYRGKEHGEGLGQKARARSAQWTVVRIPEARTLTCKLQELEGD